MSTVALPKQPSWMIVYDREKQRIVRGKPGEWQQYSQVESIDGLSVYVLDEPASMVLIQTPSLVSLHAPEPTSFFSFARSRSLLETSTQGKVLVSSHTDEWLFTVFGYILPDYRVYITVLPSHSEYHCEPRTTPFTLL